MADAKKCDRCGAFYELRHEQSLLVRRNCHAEDYFTYDYDLCNNCVMKLEAFLKNKDGEKAKNISEELNKRGCRNEIMAQNAALNAARKQKLNGNPTPGNEY